MVALRVQLRARVAAALPRYDVQQHRHAHLARPGKRAFQRLHVVSVHGAEVVKAEVVEHILRQDGLLDALLQPVRELVHRLHTAHRAPVPALEAEVARLHAHPAQELRHAADVRADRHCVVVQDDHERFSGLPRVRKALIGQAARERAVAYDGGDVIVPAQPGPRPGHAQRHGNAVRGVARDEGVRPALRGLRKARHPAVLPQPREARAAARQQFVRITLVPHVEHQPVSIWVVHAVERNAELHRPKVRGQVAPSPGHVFYEKAPYLAAELRELLPGQSAQVGYIIYIFKQSQSRYLLTFFAAAPATLVLIPY